MRLTILVLAGLVACGGGKDDDGDGTDDTSTTTETTDATTPYAGFTDLTWELHDDVDAFAIVRWEQAAAGTSWVEFSVDEGVWLKSPAVERPAGPAEQLVVGIPYDEDAVWRVVADAGMVDAPEPIETGNTPRGLPPGRVSAAEPGGWLPDGNFLLTSVSETGGGWNSNGPFWTVIVDRRGRPVWARVTRQNSWTLYAMVSQDRTHILYDEFSWFGGDAMLTRSYLDGELEQIPIPGFHHAFVELPDGTIAWASRAHGGGEAIVEKAPGSSEEKVIWTCADNWPESEGMCASNCIFYDVERNSYLYSFYSNESVLELDRATGETLWWAGGVEGGYVFDPPQSHFYWQHGVSWTDAGTLLLSTHDQPWANTNLAREYEVDFEFGVLREIWSYDARAVADTNGDTWRLANGNTLHTLGSASQIKEVAPDGRSVWHLDFEGSNLLGRSEWIDDLYTLVKP